MDWVGALWAGLAGGVVMAIWAMAMHWTGVSRMSMSAYEGAMLTGRVTGMGTTAAGMMMHMAISVVVGFVYAVVFENVIGGAGWLWGLVGGLVHWIVGGFVMPMMDRMHGPVQRGEVRPAGLFESGYGGGAVFMFLGGHLLYGLVVGLVYGWLRFGGAGTGH